jgi:hypothetical protein
LSSNMQVLHKSYHDKKQKRATSLKAPNHTTWSCNWLALLSRCPRVRKQLLLTDSSVVSLKPARKISVQYFKTSHECFLPLQSQSLQHFLFKAMTGGRNS